MERERERERFILKIVKAQQAQTLEGWLAGLRPREELRFEP